MSINSWLKRIKRFFTPRSRWTVDTETVETSELRASIHKTLSSITAQQNETHERINRAFQNAVVTANELRESMMGIRPVAMTPEVRENVSVVVRDTTGLRPADIDLDRALVDAITPLGYTLDDDGRLREIMRQAFQRSQAAVTTAPQPRVLDIHGGERIVSSFCIPPEKKTEPPKIAIFSGKRNIELEDK